MWMYAVVTVAVCVVTYIYYTLTSSSGSSFQDNSIDAFIRKGPVKETPKQKVKNEDKYKKSYSDPGRQVLIIFGTEYGFSEEVARYVFDRLKETKHPEDGETFQPRLINAKYHDIIDWSLEQVCFIIISTSGDGVPPSDAEEFYKKTFKSSNQFNNIKYTVLAMGDSNYPQFCKTGRSLDKSLREQSAVCMVPCHDVDMEEWTVIDSWLDQVVEYLITSEIDIRYDYLDISGLEESCGHDRHHPFMAKIKIKKLLTSVANENDKETIHCEFDIADSGLSWISGDALGIYPENNPRHVEEILQCLEFSGEEILDIPSWAHKPNTGSGSLVLLLRKYYDLKHVKPDLISLLIEKSSSSIKNSLQHSMENGVSKSNKALHDYLNTHEVIDVIQELSPLNISPQNFVDCLKSLQPRYYSISSSPLMDTNTVCVTAAVVRYDLQNIRREGVTTTFLQDRLSVPEMVPVFISKNPDFRLPSNPDIPVILIGPGTGIAPFRAFIQERELCGSKGKTHLYFGCRHKHRDFLYRDELENYERNGTINLSVAFSRDQENKVYVQDLLKKDSQKIWNLLNEESACIYVCGDAKHMAKDVHKMLLSIVQKEGNLEEDEADQFLKTLEEKSSYQKDVWIV